MSDMSVQPPAVNQPPSDYQVGQHVVYHHFDGRDYEAVITEVWEPGSPSIESRWSVHINAGKLGVLKNITQASREDTQPEGTFSFKPKLTGDDDNDRLATNARPGTALPTRADENPRARADASEPLKRGVDYTLSAEPEDAPQPDYEADALEEVRDDQVQRETTPENKGDPGLDTPANYLTDGKTEAGETWAPPSDEKRGTTKTDDDEHVDEKAKKSAKGSTTKGSSD
jgi:hypothetical protein